MRGRGAVSMWPNEKVLQFIKDFQAHPCLWDAYCPDNKNRHMKYDAIDFLAKNYGTYVSDVEKKISNLKSQFRRERRKIIEARKSGASPKKPSWFAYEALLFLMKQKESNKEELDTTLGLLDATTVDAELAESLEEYPLENKRKNLEEEGVIFQREASKAKAGPNEDIGLLEAFNCMKSLVKIASQRDRFSIYGEHVASKLRNSGKSTREISIAQHHIDQICFNLDIDVYSRRNSDDHNKEVRYNYGYIPVNAVLPEEQSCSSTSMPSPADSEDIVKLPPQKKRVTKNNLKNAGAVTSFDLECDVKSENEFSEEPWDDTVIRYPTKDDEESGGQGGPIHGHEIFFTEVEPKLEPEDDMDDL